MRAAALAGRVVVVDCPDAPSAAALESELSGEAVFASSSWRRVRSLRHAHAERLVRHEGTAPMADGPFDGALVFVPKSRARVEWVLSTTADAVRVGSPVWVSGHKKAGIASAARRLGRLVGPASKLLSARHCMLHSADVSATREAPEAGPEPWEHAGLRIAAPPGVFSAGRLDDGTAMLLANLPAVGGRVLDLGCGAGVIAAVCAAGGARDVLAVDDDAVALAATRETVARNGLAGRVKVAASDGFSDVEGRFDFVVSNPPFHDGIATTDVAAQRFVSDAARHLERDGQLVVVGNRFLKYPAWFDATFRRWDLLAEDGRYRVMRAFGRDARSR